jgi:hypothetical protein
MRGLKEALEALEALEQKRELAFVGATTGDLALAPFPSGFARCVGEDYVRICAFVPVKQVN